MTFTDAHCFLSCISFNCFQQCHRADTTVYPNIWVKGPKLPCLGSHSPGVMEPEETQAMGHKPTLHSAKIARAYRAGHRPTAQAPVHARLRRCKHVTVSW